MQRLEVSGAVRLINVVRRQRVKEFLTKLSSTHFIALFEALKYRDAGRPA